jgi:benzoyl-CoA reductase/2-hydroxyglutaryl-CoA dehydratase subunit BcrC/BadD/HgdB
MENMEFFSEFSEFLKKKREEGTKIVAYLAHDNLPEELIDASGCFPLRMMFAGNDDLMNASHDYLPPSTCAFTQSCIGLFSLKPAQYRFLGLIDYFIVSNHCVSDVCGSEVITKYFNIPRLNFYLPYTKSENSLKYFKLELQDFKEQLEKINNSKIADDVLIKSLKKYNDFKKQIGELNNLNLAGSKKLRKIQEAMLYGPYYSNKLSEFIENNKENVNSTDSKKDIILTGCSAFMDDYLMNLIEDGGGNVLFFDSWIGNHYYSQVFSDEDLESNDPYELLVKRFHRNTLSDHSVPNFLDNKITQLINLNKSYKETNKKNIGVINHIIKFCDHFSMLSAYFKEELQSRGIQVLNLERDYSRANKGQLSTRIEAYLEMI